MINRLINFLTLSFFSIHLHADSYSSKDWDYNLSNPDYAWAATANNKGRILGQYCYYDEESCMYLVSFGTTCDEGAEYTALANTNNGAYSLNLICGHEYKKQNVFYVTPFKEIDSIVKDASIIGFALPLESGSFKVVRFSLRGSTYAIKMMRDGADAVLNNKPTYNLRSEQYL
jgi:hypothetical protein